MVPFLSACSCSAFWTLRTKSIIISIVYMACFCTIERGVWSLLELTISVAGGRLLWSMIVPRCSSRNCICSSTVVRKLLLKTLSTPHDPALVLKFALWEKAKTTFSLFLFLSLLLPPARWTAPRGRCCAQRLLINSPLGARLRPQEKRSHVKHTRRKIMVLKWFFKRLCGSTKNHHLLKNHVFIWGAIIGYLKNSLRKWFFKEPWFERFFVEPEMVP